MRRKRIWLVVPTLLVLVCLVNFFRVETPLADLNEGDVLRVEAHLMSEVPRELTEEQVDELLGMLRQVRLHHRIYPGALNGDNGACRFILYMSDGSECVVGFDETNQFVLNGGFWRSEQELCRAIYDFYAELWADSGWEL